MVKHQLIDFAYDLHMESTWFELWPGHQLSLGFCLFFCLLHVNAGRVKVKVKFTLEQAMKVQKGSRGIAALFP
jgi:hypothetical protein